MRSGRGTPDSDRFVTRLIPLRYIDAEAISNTLKPLVSKDASMVAYPPTNTVILTDSASNIRRILSILESIDVETFKEELARDQGSSTPTRPCWPQQLSEIFGAEVSARRRGHGGGAARRARPQASPGQPTPRPRRSGASEDQVRIITDERTNSLIVLASRAALGGDPRPGRARLDVPVDGRRPHPRLLPEVRRRRGARRDADAR